MAEKERWDGWLGPKQWMPVVGILSLAIIGLAVMLVLNMGDDEDANAGNGSGSGRVPTHVHADFALYIRGERFDFNRPEFITTEDEAVSPNVHLHEPRYDVAHVHTTLTKWDEFFSSLGFTLTDPSFPGVEGNNVCMTLPGGVKLCNNGTDTWKFIANGVPVDGLSNVIIGDLSRVLFSYGPETIDQVMAQQYPQVTNQACIPSELCLDRVDPNEPPEICSGGTTCQK
jgi:hypothetical protein